MIKLCVFGSRGYSDYPRMCQHLDQFVASQNTSDISIISGMAAGADSLAVRYAKERGLKLLPFPANWKQYGKSAGILRNAEMAKEATHFIAFWDGLSKGTGHMISKIKKGVKPLLIVLFEKEIG